jgi:hypothetical protein
MSRPAGIAIGRGQAQYPAGMIPGGAKKSRIAAVDPTRENRQG